MKNFGLLGEKLTHSFSKIIHEYIFEKLEINASYSLFEVDKKNVDDFKKYMLDNDVLGVNITIPYKKTFIEKVDFLSETAKKISAINLLYIKNGKFYGENTDYFGFYKSLLANNIDVFGKKVYILGRGGGEAAVKKVLEDMKAKEIITLFREDKTKSIVFPDDIGGDILINTTPVGMYPNVNYSIANKNILSKFLVAIDLIYNPTETLFLKTASSLGLKTLNGLDMLIEQAIKTDEILLDVKIDDGLRREVKKMLKTKIIS